MKSNILDEILSKVVADSDVPGVVAYVANEDNVIYKGAFGKSNVSSGDEMTLDTVFWIASMTKAITSVAAMQLVEQGKLNLDQPLKKIIPELNEIKVMVGMEDGEPVLREPKQEITLRHLLTHTSGFTYHFGNENTVNYIKAKNLDMGEGQNESLMTALDFDPGERWEYGISVDWVGKAVEAVSGQNLRDYFKDYIFNPLGMTDTDFVIQTEQRKRLVSMHVRDEENQLTPIPFEMPQNPEFFMGGGGLYSTARDYTTFLQMILQGGIYKGRRILETSTVEEMCKNQIGELNVRPLKSVNSTLASEYEAFPGMVKKWGLGFLITTEDAPTGRKAGSLSWAGMGNTYYWIDPTSRITAVILTQLLPFADQRVLNLLDKFETTTYELINEKSNAR